MPKNENILLLFRFFRKTKRAFVSQNRIGLPLFRVFLDALGPSGGNDNPIASHKVLAQLGNFFNFIFFFFFLHGFV
jgi:hypothetical protein